MSEAGELHAALALAASERYRNAGLFARKFALGKLEGDPAFFSILERGLIPDSSRLLDLGCGQGLMAAWLLAAQARHESGRWPARFPAPPRMRQFTGIELMDSDVARARDALGDRAVFIGGDVRTVDFEPADAAIILDVLHYMDRADQMSVLERVRDALKPSPGTLLLRVGDASGGFRFNVSRWVDHAVTFARGHRLSTLHCRPLSDWQSLLNSLGFAVEAHPMSEGTPFANVLLVARL